MCIYAYDKTLTLVEMDGGACDITIVVIRNGINYTSSNSE